MNVRNSLWTLLVQNEVAAPEEVVASIRLAMTAAIDELSNTDVRDLDSKVSNATDISELWNLRPELMQAMEAEQGEDIARNRLNKITDMFRKY